MRSRPRPSKRRQSNRQPGGRFQRVIKSMEANLRAGRLQEVWDEGSAALQRWANEPQLHFLMAAVAERSQEPPLVLRHAEKVIALKPHPDAMMMLSNIERRKGNTDAAVDWCDRALTLRPAYEPYLIQKAGTLEEAGRYTDARSVVDPLIEEFASRGKPLPAALRFELAKLLVQEKSYDRAVDVIDDFVSEKTTPEELARLGYYLRAKAHDRAGRYDEAFASASLANDIGRLDFDAELYEEQVATLIETWSAENMAKFPLADCDDELPVFVAGMPRSGTSLIDQIIDAHPQASGVGELSAIEAFAAELSSVYDPDEPPPECFGPLQSEQWTQVALGYIEHVRALAPDSERVVNKALGNNKLVGLLARLFPKTRIIHALRDPRDVALSCYMGGFNNQLHAWTTRIEWASRAWDQSQRLMDHWKATLDISIIDVNYEELVRDPDTQFPRLIEFLGLDWNETCRDFYKRRRTVRTLSYDQVNRPLYTTSAGRHPNYASQINDDCFSPYLK